MLFLLNACTKEVDETKIITSMVSPLKEISQEELDSLVKNRIYFGHQSVGYNLMDGIKENLLIHSNVHINIQEGNQLDLFEKPILAHGKNGKNGDPKSKIDDFCAIMESGLGEKVDIAGFKFCYVDIKKETNIEEIFDHYKKNMDKLILKFPDVNIIHFTAPIRTPQQGIKGFINNILGRNIGVEDNFARQKFNELILKEYEKKNVFDIAKYESTYQDGSREYKLVNNEKVFSMVPAYTFDGGHLSNTGKKIIGEEFLLFLVKVSNDGKN